MERRPSDSAEAPPLDFGRVEEAGPAGPFRVTAATVEGVRLLASTEELEEVIRTKNFFWLDLCGGLEAERAAYLSALRLSEPDAAWLQRFGQPGRLAIARQRLCAATWLWERLGGGLTEVHLLCLSGRIVTVWNGEARVLDEIRAHFVERLDELAKSPFEAGAILLQLLLARVHMAISEIDARLQATQALLRAGVGPTDFVRFSEQMQRLQSSWSAIDRYSSEVRTAIIGIEALPGVDAGAARELNDYAGQVEHLEHRLQERSRWGLDLLQDYATGVAQRQSEQISRLTLVSLIFLPITFLTGFFGMNFKWMMVLVESPAAFLVLGLAAPVLVVAATLVWLRRRGLI